MATSESRKPGLKCELVHVSGASGPGSVACPHIRIIYIIYIYYNIYNILSARQRRLPPYTYNTYIIYIL